MWPQCRSLSATASSKASITRMHITLIRSPLSLARCQSTARSSSLRQGQHEQPDHKQQRGFTLPWSSVIALVSVATLGAYVWQGQVKSKSNRMSYAAFTSLIVDDIKPITQDSSLVSLRVRADQLPDASLYPDPCDTPLQAIYVRQPELQIQRAYTPLDLAALRSDTEAHRTGGIIKLLVKRYNDGEVSSFLHRQRTGDAIDVRGPVRTWSLPPCEHLIYIAGGTGLTPLIQLVSEGAALPKRITVLYASSASSRNLVKLLPASDRLDLHTIDGRIQDKDIVEYVGRCQSANYTQIIVCGPDGFVADIAGARASNSNIDIIGGHLGALGWTHENVKKL